MEPKKFDLAAMTEKAKTAVGIDITKLKAGTELLIETVRGTVYQIKIINPFSRQVEIVGGKHLPTPLQASFTGSTYGGNMIRSGWIGRMMNMEVRLPKKRVLTTSPVVRAKVIGDGWDYDMEWETQNTNT